MWYHKQLQERNATIKFHVIVYWGIFCSLWQPVYLQIWVLRDIIGELENQLEMKTQHEVTLQQRLHDLQAILEQQSKTQQELTEEVSYCLITLMWCLCWMLKMNWWLHCVSPSLCLHFVVKATQQHTRNCTWTVFWFVQAQYNASSAWNSNLTVCFLSKIIFLKKQSVCIIYGLHFMYTIFIEIFLLVVAYHTENLRSVFYVFPVPLLHYCSWVLFFLLSKPCHESV